MIQQRGEVGSLGLRQPSKHTWPLGAHLIGLRHPLELELRFWIRVFVLRPQR